MPAIRSIALPLLAAATMLGGCATVPRAGPTDVVRYHLGAAPAPGSFVVEPLSTNSTLSLEYQAYADAVAAEMTRLGFARGTGGASAYVAQVSLIRAPAGAVQVRSPLSIGIGGGTGGRNVGVGGGLSVPVGGGGVRDVIATTLTVQLLRRADQTVVWEGRAVNQTVSGTPDNETEATAARMAGAMFREFPGESGITTTVR